MRFGKIDNYLLFGGGDLLLKTAIFLLNQKNEVCVVTSDRHYSEKLMFINECSFGEFLNKNSIKHIISKNVLLDNSVKKQISKNTMGLSFGAAWIFKKKFIDLFGEKLLNLHGSRLPYDRGAGGFSWRIMMGDKIGVTLVQQIQPGVDTGDIIDYKTFVFPENCKIPLDYYRISIDRYFSFLIQFFNKTTKNIEFNCTGQPEYLSIYWPRLHTDTHGYIDWSNDVVNIEKFICAFDDPYNGAITYLNGEKIRVKKVFSMNAEGVFHPFQSGIIYRIVDGIVTVAANNGSLLINEIINEIGKNIITNLKVGDRLYTPREKIEKAIQYRAVYSPSGLMD
jgi:methionyl-tRNA formyltransferase